MYLASKMHVNFLNNETLHGGADKSLARPSSRCCRTESILSLGRYWSVHVQNCKSFLVTEAERSCSCMTMLLLTSHLQPPRIWPTWASSVLITHPILRTCPPSDYHLFPGLKKQLKFRHFSSDVEVIAAAKTRLEGQNSDFF